MAAGIYYTNDGGTTWSHLDTSTFDINNLKDLLITKEGELQLLGDNGVFNLDETMVPLTNKVSIIDKFQTKKIDDFFVITNKDKEIYKIPSTSPDYYYTSSQITTSEDLSSDFNIIACSEDGLFLLAVSGNRLYESTDAGLNWEYETPSFTTINSLAMSAFSEYAYVSGNTNILAVRKPTGTSYTTVIANTNYFIKSIACSNDGKKVILGIRYFNSPSEDNFLFISNDYGSTFSSVDLPDNPGYSIKKVVCTYEGNYVAFSLVNESSGQSILYYYDGISIYNRDTFAGLYGDIAYDNRREGGWGFEAPGDTGSIEPRMAFNSLAYLSNGLSVIASEYNGYLYKYSSITGTLLRRNTDKRRRWTNVDVVRYSSSSFVACEYNGYIWITSDNGETWTPKMTDAKRKWTSISGYYANSSRTILVACEYDGYIYTSTDLGETWTARMTDSRRNWTSISCPSMTLSSGTYYADIIACEYNGYIYTSVGNNGSSFTSRATDTRRKWKSVGASENLQYAIAAEYNGYIYTSIDSCATWSTNGNSSGIKKWSFVPKYIPGSSYRFYVGSFDGYAGYTTNMGTSWTTYNIGTDYRYSFIYYDNIYSIFSAIYGKGMHLYSFSPAYNSFLYNNKFDTLYNSTILSNKYAYSSDGIIIYLPGKKIKKSIDGGLSWKELSSSTETKSISCDSTGNILYANSFSKSIDGGITWVYLNMGEGGNIVCDSTGTNIVAYGVNGYLNLSHDGGLTYTSVANRNNITWTACSISGDGQKIVACANSTSSYAVSMVIISIDGGVTWKIITPYNLGEYCYFTDITISKNGTNIYLPERTGGYLLVSNDSGLSWTKKLHKPAKTIFSTISLNSSGNMILGSVNSSYYSATGLWYNNGTSWSEIEKFQNKNVLTTSSLTGSKIAAAIKYEGISLSSDYGSTWTDININTSAQNWYKISCSSNGTYMVAIGKATDGTYGNLYTSSNSGVSWTVRMTDFVRDWKAVAIDSTGQYLYATDNHYIYKSLDYGVTWNSIYSTQPLTQAASRLIIYDIKCSSNGSFVAFCNDSEIWISTNGGITWTLNYTSANTLNSLAMNSDGTSMLVGTDNKILYTHNSGSSWSVSGDSVKYTGVSMSSSGTKMCSLSFYTNNYYYISVSLDGGASWTNRGGFTVNPVGTACNSDGTTMIVGYGSKLYKSTDSGTNWSNTTITGTNVISSCCLNSTGTIIGVAECNNGSSIYGNIWISSNSGTSWAQKAVGINNFWTGIKSNSDCSIIMAYGTQGVFVSIDSGSTWAQKTSLTNITEIAINSTGSIMYAAANSTGVYKSTNYGTSWTTLTSSLYYVKPTTVTCDSTGTYVGFGGALYGGNAHTTLYISQDAGASWGDCLTNSAISSIRCSSNGSIWYVSSSNIIYKSTNYGVNWSAITGSIGSSGLYISSDGTIIYSTLSPTSTQESNVYYSLNSGSNWNQYGTYALTNGEGCPIKAVCSSTGNIILVNTGDISYNQPATPINPGYVYMSSNYGADWVKSIAVASDWMTMVSDDSSTIKAFNLAGTTRTQYTYRGSPLFYFSKNDGLRKSTTKEITSTDIILGTTGNPQYISCGYLNNITYYQSNRIKYSDDQATWSYLDIPTPSYICSSKYLKSSNLIKYTNNKYIYSCDIYNNIFNSSTPKNYDLMKNSINGSKITCNNAGTIIYIYDNYGNLYRSSDSGITFARIALVLNSSMFSNSGVCENIVCSSDGIYVFLTLTDIVTENYYLWVSIDSGITFTKIVSNQFKYVTVDSTGTKLYACNNSGYIYYSNNYGSNWTQLASGIRTWLSIATNYNGGTAIVAGTNGSYVYKSYDSGSIWTNDIKYGTGSWKKVLISADGSKFIATATAMDGTSVLEDLHGNFDLSILEEDSHNGSTIYYSKTYFEGVNGDYSFVINHSKTSSPYYTTCNYVGDKIFIHHNSYENILFSVGAFSEKVSSIRVENKNLSAINYLTSNKIYYSTYNGEVYNEINKDLTSFKTGNRTWSTVSTNYLGDVVLAAADSEYAYISRDYGDIYEKVTDIGIHVWSCSTMSSDGSSIIICENNGAMHKGTYSSGSYTWSTLTSAGNKNWSSVSMSSNGSWIVACVNNDYIYVSSNGGTSWTTYMNDSARDWKDIKIRTNNSYQTIVACSSSLVFTSSNGGNSWTEITSGLPSLTLEKISFDYINQLDPTISVIVAAANNNIYIKEQTLSWAALTTGKTYTNAVKIELSYLAGTQTYLVFAVTNGNSFIGISYNNNQTWKEINFGNYDKVDSVGWNSGAISGNFNTMIAAHSLTEYDNNLVVIKKIDSANSNSNENITPRILYQRNLFKTGDENYTWKYITVDDVTAINDDNDVISELPTSEFFWNTTISEAPGNWYNNINTKRIISAISKSQTINNEFKYYIINCLENNKKIGNNKNGFFIMYEDGVLEALISNIEIYSLTQQHSTMSTNLSNYTYSGSIEKTFPVKFIDNAISFEVSSIYGKVNVISFDESKMMLESETISQVKDICNVRAVGRWKK